MKSNPLKAWEKWFLKGEQDEHSAKDLLVNEMGSPSTICFLSQQMAEKFLKGYLVEKQKRFPKIHQLDALRKLCESMDATFSEIGEETEFLTGFYVSTRYPGDYPEVSFKQAKQAFQNAKMIKGFVVKRIS